MADICAVTRIGLTGAPPLSTLCPLPDPPRTPSVATNMPWRSFNSSVSPRHREHFQANLVFIRSPVPNKSGQFTHKTHEITHRSNGQKITTTLQKHPHNRNMSLYSMCGLYSSPFVDSSKMFSFFFLLLVETTLTNERRSDKLGRTGL